LYAQLSNIGCFGKWWISAPAGFQYLLVMENFVNCIVQLARRLYVLNNVFGDVPEEGNELEVLRTSAFGKGNELLREEA
jgi:hypothetical protein